MFGLKCSAVFSFHLRNGAAGRRAINMIDEAALVDTAVLTQSYRRGTQKNGRLALTVVFTIQVHPLIRMCAKASCRQRAGWWKGFGHPLCV